MLKNFRFYMSSIGTIFVILFGATVFAAPICPVPVEVTQPNGDVITVTSYGDEFFSWQEDENGNIIAYDEESRSYKYAEIRDGKIVPTSQEVKGNITFQLCSNEIFSHKIQREDIVPLWESAERIDYSKLDKDNGIQLMSADKTQETVETKKLLTILIEFEDVKMHFSNQFWHDEMFDTTPGALSVVNYWKENANGVDVFAPANTSEIKKKEKQEGIASDEDYINIKYRIEEVSEGVVRVSLDMLHPIKTWDDRDGTETCKTVALAIKAIEQDFDFSVEQPHIVTIFAGYDDGISEGKGQGQVGAHTSPFTISASDGIDLGRYTVQGELQQKDVSVGIGTICHELGHSVFYLPDLYFTRLPNGPGNALHYYSLMSFGSWGQRYTPLLNETMDYGNPYAAYWGHVPSHLDPWCKIKCGFVTPTLVTDWDGNINSISDTENESKYNVIKVRSKADPKQYFLIENRQPIGFDKGLEALDKGYFEKTFAGGILIYHIDENVSYSYNNNTDMHTFMYIERSNNGSGRTIEEAKWAYSNQEGVNKFNNETEPNSNLHEADNLKVCSLREDCHPQTVESGILIEVLSESSPSMQVKVTVDKKYRVEETGETFSDIFQDINFCNAVIEMLSEDGKERNTDDIISVEDWIKISVTENLSISNRNIKSLNGIKYFPKLMDITCSNNELTELDFSNNTELNYIDCKNNRLTELNVSACKNLMFLYCNNNLLKNLEIQDNKELLYLYCSDNELTKLNVKENSDLSKLWCYNNYMDEDYTSGIEGVTSLKQSLVTSANKFKYLPQKTEGENPTPPPSLPPSLTPTASPMPSPSISPTPAPTAEPSPTPTAEQSPTPTVEPSPTPTPKTGDRIEFEQTDDKVTAKLIFDSTVPPAESNIWLIVAYRENGQLKRIEIPEISDMTTEFNCQDCDIIVYVWDKDMKPLMEVQKFKKQ